MLTVTLYTKKECHLCEQAKADLAALQEQVPHQLVEIDIESDPALHQKYLVEIPVVQVGPYRKVAPFNKQDLLITLSAARDRQASLDRLGSPEYLDRVKRGQTISRTDRFSLAFSKYYIWLLNLVMFLYVGLPFLAPVLMKNGYVAPAKVIYTAYSPLCHELGFRSFFLFGEQAFYPRASAGVEGVLTFGQATGLNENDLWAARAYTGNEQVGYKVALCERDVAIYAAILLFGVIFAITGRRIPPLHWMLWLLIGIAPIGLDGFSQLFSQAIPQLNAIFPYRESTPFLRVLTGGLFGFTTAWFGYPYIEESMRETRALLLKKIAIIDQVNKA
jgi:uncharacterized membrane protein/glutaredoxin